MPQDDLLARYPLVLPSSLRIPQVIGTFALIFIIISGIVIFLRKNHLRQPFSNQEHPSIREQLLDVSLFLMTNLGGIPLHRLDDMIYSGREMDNFAEFQVLNILVDFFGAIFSSIIIPLIIFLRIKSYRATARKNAKNMLGMY